MIVKAGFALQLLAGASVVALLAATPAAAQDAPIVQPGAPGQATRTLSPEEAARISNNRYSADDVRFMQEMILHHAQAVEMAALVEARTNNPAVVELAGRINASQADEMAFMRGWLTERGEQAPDPADPHAMHSLGHHDHSSMVGMASSEQMAELAAASGAAFDRQFLQLMIRHHEGAVEMVDHLLGRPGSAYDPVLYQFVTDVKNEQQAEIRRMGAELRGLAEDPRTTLTGGFRDAGQAIDGMRLVASLPKVLARLA